MAIACLAIAALASEARGQSDPSIVPTRWPSVVYPQIAQSARIQGHVEVAVDVAPDGRVLSAEAVSGPPLLRQAVVDAARHAVFDCRECTTAATRYSLYATFRLFDPSKCLRKEPPLVVSPTQGWVTVDAPLSGIICIYYAWMRVRGPRCLYLWRCESEWGGMRDRHDPVRSKRCLGLWKCGWSKQPAVDPDPAPQPCPTN